MKIEKNMNNIRCDIGKIRHIHSVYTTLEQKIYCINPYPNSIETVLKVPVFPLSLYDVILTHYVGDLTHNFVVKN